MPTFIRLGKTVLNKDRIIALEVSDPLGPGMSWWIRAIMSVELADSGSQMVHTKQFAEHGAGKTHIMKVGDFYAEESANNALNEYLVQLNE